MPHPYLQILWGRVYDLPASNPSRDTCIKQIIAGRADSNVGVLLSVPWHNTIGGAKLSGRLTWRYGADMEQRKISAAQVTLQDCPYMHYS